MPDITNININYLMQGGVCQDPGIGPCVLQNATLAPCVEPPTAPPTALHSTNQFPTPRQPSVHNNPPHLPLKDLEQKPIPTFLSGVSTSFIT